MLIVGKFSQALQTQKTFSKMARKKSIIIMPRLNDVGGNLSKPWFVEYSCRNPHTDVMKRFRIYDGFKELTTIKERYEYADSLIAEIRSKLEKGITPFTDEERTVVYEDELMYHNAARIWGRQKSSVVTIRTHLSEFLKLKEVEVIHHTYQTYMSKLRIFCMYMEKMKLDQIHVSLISNEHICDFVRYLVADNELSRRSILKYKQILFNFFQYLLKNKKVIDRNPVEDLPNVGVRKDCAPHPIPDNIRKILKNEISKCDPQLWLVCQIQFYSAIRPGEEIRLMKIGDINFDSQTITIRKDIAKNRETETVDIPKQLYKEFVEVYQLHLYPTEYYVFGTDGEPGATHLGKNSFRFRFDKIRDRLGISSKYKLYSFKHTGASKLKEKGISTWELQRHLRHKSISTTENYIRRTIGIRSETIKNEFPDI